MNFQPQPYPLFIARTVRGTVRIGRIVGWVAIKGGDDVDLKAIAFFDDSDGFISKPQQLVLHKDLHWIGESRSDVRRQAELALAEGRER